MMVLAESLAPLEVVELDAKTPQGYWEQFKRCSQQIRGQGLTPVLLLDNPTRPVWLWNWIEDWPGKDDTGKPEDLVFESAADAPTVDGYQGKLNQVELYSAPLSYGASLLVAKELFSRLRFQRFEDGGLVQVEWRPVVDEFAKIDLALHWGVEVVVGPKVAFKLRYGDQRSRR
jgi:hypothetical protein